MELENYIINLDLYETNVFIEKPAILLILWIIKHVNKRAIKGTFRKLF